MKPSFSTSEVASFCHVTADTIRKWSESGRIRAFKTPGGHRRIRREDVLRFLREHGIPVPRDLRDAESKILVVSQDGVLSATIQRFLERSRSSFLVQSARDSFDAGRLVSLFQPDVVLFDLGLPGVNAIDLCRRIVESPDSAGIRVVAVASGDQAEQSKEAAAKGFPVLKKPFSPDDLRKVLAAVDIELT